MRSIINKNAVITNRHPSLRFSTPTQFKAQSFHSIREENETYIDL